MIKTTDIIYSRVALPLFVAVSMLVHTLVLLTWSLPTASLTQQEQAISVHINSNSQPVPAPSVTAQTITKKKQENPPRKKTTSYKITPTNAANKKKTVTKNKPVIKHEQVAHTVKMTLPVKPSAQERPGERPAKTSSVPTASHKATVFKNRVLGTLKTMFSKYFSYPELARRRGLSGDVTLGFHIAVSGQLHNIHIVKSSGYGLLDRSAVKTLKRINAIKMPASTINWQGVDMQLPVSYRLKEG